MNTIDRTVELKLPNNPGHVLHYTVKSIIECEKELTNRNLILTVASLAASPLSISDAYTLLKWGLRGEKAYRCASNKPYSGAGEVRPYW